MKTTTQTGQRFMIPGKEQIHLESYRLPPLGEQDILVRNAFTAVSTGTELFDYVHWLRDGKPAAGPITSGYSCAGTVIAVGSGVHAVKAGDRVCGQGIHSSHCVLKPPYQLIPEGVSLEEASMTVLAAVALHGIRKACIELGQAVAVFGVGIIGQLTLSLAKLAGAFPLIALDIRNNTLDVAKQRGVQYCFNTAEMSDYIDHIKACTPNNGADIVIEATGIPALYPQALKLACSAGKVISLGSPRGRVEMNFLPELHKQELSLIGAFQPLTPTEDHLYCRWTKQKDRDLIVNLLASGVVSWGELITEIADPHDCQDVYHMLSRKDNDHLGVIFDWKSV